MIGIGYGDSSYGYFAGAAILFITIIILLILLGKLKAAGLPYSTNSISVQNENIGVAMLMTSPVGDVVYANKAAKKLFDKYEFGAPQSPLKLDISNKNNRGKISGYGTAVGYVGTLLSLGMAFLILQWFGPDTEFATRMIFPATAIFFLGFSLITFFNVKDKKEKNKGTIQSYCKKCISIIKTYSKEY